MSTSGSIIRRGRKSWRLKFEKGKDPETGARRIGFETVKGSRKEAQERLTAILQSLNRGTFVERTPMTLSQFLKQWLADYARHQVSRKTYERWTEIVDKHLVPALGTGKLADLKPLDIQSYYSQALSGGRRDGNGGLAPRTVLHHHRVLSQALRQAVRWRVIAVNPAEDATPPAPDHVEIAILADDELLKVLNTARPTRSYTAILLAATTGMRRGEVLGLRWRDLDLAADTATLTVNHTLEETKSGLKLKDPKSKRSRRNITLPMVTVEALRRHKAAQAEERLQLGLGRADDGYVFAALDGGPIRPRNLSKEFTRIVARADVRKVSFHSLRHTHASQLLRDGVHVKVVSERLGHATVSITLDTYAHVIPNMQADAAARIHAAFADALAD